MKNMEKALKTKKVCMTITAVVMALTLMGVIIDFVQTGTWSGQGCSVLAVNSAIFCVNYDSYRKAKEEQ